MIQRKRYLLAGAMGSFLLIKPQFALFMPLILVKESVSNIVKSPAGFLAVAIVLISVGVNELGLLYPIDYIKYVFASENNIYGTQFEHISS